MTILEASLLLAATTLVASFIAYYFYARAQLRRLAHYKYWSDRFFASAKRLVDEPATPERVIALVDDINDLITEPNAAIGLYKVYANKLKNPPAQRAKLSAQEHEEFEKFFAQRPDLVDALEQVVHSGLLALTYTSVIWGVPARAVLAEAFGQDSKSSLALHDVKEVNRKVHCGTQFAHAA
jgi:hypothetical protein